MNFLAEKKCEVCAVGAPVLSEQELEELLPQISQWRIVEQDGIKRLVREYKFKNFVEALAFANKVGAIAEEENHHPAITVEWGKTTVAWWTHKIKGLHRNDVIMAAKTDGLI